MSKVSFTRAMLNDLVAQNDRALNDRKHISLNNQQLRKIVIALNLRIDALEKNICDVWDDYVEFNITKEERDTTIGVLQYKIDELRLIVNTINPAQ